jgi:photosystem II stability/assembly factor-like uncharacterized protein
MQSLVFFNKEGDNLNFRYNDVDELWEGDIIFHANSDDTFKTAGLYVFEKIPSFEYERPGDMQLEKFQLFNEYRFNITGNSYFTQSISKIEMSNVDTSFYSKWVYGENFEKKFPMGSQIRFDQSFLEFNNYDKSYTVVKTKKNGIMIMTDLDNRSFNEQYGALIEESSTYFFNVNSTTYSYSISGVNSIGIYDYIKPDYTENLSSWSEPNFYDRYFNGRALNLINTNRNDGVYNVKNINLNDKIYTRYTLDARYLTQSLNLMVDVTLKTELPTVYSGVLGLTNSRVYFGSKIPKILKPGVEFFVPASTLNTNGIFVSSIRDFNRINKLTYFDVDSQVIYQNNIYQCILAHTWSGTSSIIPTNTTYWSSPNYLPVTYELVYENFNFTEVQLTKNRFTYSQFFTQSIDVTFGSSIQNYASDLRFFNIDYYYENKRLYADLIYPSNYADVKFFIGTGSLVDSTIKLNIYEQNVEVEEILVPEVNENICENFTYNIVFTDIDEFGIRLTINGQIYYQDVEFLYDGLEVNMERTIDKTLRNWLTTWYVQLAITGVIPKLKFSGKAYSFYLNTIQLTTEYPNVPLNFLVEVGTTANFYLQRAQVIFNKVGSYLSVTINDRTYGQTVVATNGVTDIVTTLQNWVDDYSIILEGYGIYVEALLSMLAFDVKEQDTRFEIFVNAGISALPGEVDYVINDLFVGNFGALLSSNAVVLTYGTYSFEDEQFATGQLVTINNSSRVLNNQEYNIEYLDPRILNLSYQGPFWPTLDPICNISPFITIALSNGFGATGCTLTEPYSPGGEFNFDFGDAFSVLFGASNSYVLNTDFSFKDTKRFVDLVYLSLVNRIYVMGERLTVIDSVTGKVVDEVILPEMGDGISINFNEYNNYIYCLTEDKIYVIDPLYPRLDYIISLAGKTPLSCGINPDNGDVYISYGTSQVEIWYYNNFGNNPSISYPSTPDTKNYYKFAYNKSEMDMYITADDSVVRINGSTRTFQDIYEVSGVKPDIFYQPQNSSLYVFDTTKLNNINGGIVTPLELNLSLSDWLRQPSGTTSNLNDIGFFDENKGIIVGDGGVVLRTINAGENWNVETVPTSNNLNSVSLITDGPYAGWVIAGGVGGNLIYSSDYGDTWSNFNTNLNNEVLDLKFVSPNFGYATIALPSRLAIYSEPGGTPQWTIRNISGITGNLNSIWSNSDASIVVAVGNADSIVKSSLNFSTTQLLTRKSQLNSVFVKTGSIIVVGEGSIIFRSTDTTNWYTIDPLAHPINWKSVYFPSTTGWLVGSVGSIRRTTNDGASWTSQNSGVTGVTLSSVHFVDANIGIIGGDSGTLIWTENGGSDWNNHKDLSNNNWTTNKLNSVYLISHIIGLSTKIAVGNSGTIIRGDSSKYRVIRSIGTYQSTGTLVDGTYNNLTILSTTSTYGSLATFIVIISNGTISNITIVDRGRGFASGDNITVSVNGGTVTFEVASTISLFDTITSGTTQNLNSVVFSSNPSIGIIVGNSGTVLSTNSGGLSWALITISGAGNLYSVCFYQSTVWACGASGKIFKSSNSGFTWGQVGSAISTADLTSISFRDGTDGTVVDAFGRIYNTVNGGSDWTQVKFDYNSVDFVDENNGWISGKNGIVLKTTDGGAIWNYIYSGTTQSLTSVYFSDVNIGYVSGPNGLLRKSASGGVSRSWTSQNSGSSTLNNFSFVDNLTGYAVGDGGIIYKTEKDPPLVRNLAFDNINSNMFLSTPDGITTFDLDGNLVDKGITPDFGPIVLNQLDGDIYLASQNNQSLFVYDTKKFYFKHSQYFPEGRVKKLIYNPDRQSIFGIIPNNIIEQQSIFELRVSLGSELVKDTTTYSIVGEYNYGTLDPSYTPHPDLWLKTREYIRKPRENYNDEPLVDFVWKWVDDQTPEIFLYDFSGDQLTTGTSFSYSGPKPLPLVTLNRKPNTKLDRVGLSEFQQTIFDEITYTLDRVDDQNDFITKPTPMEIFIGSNSEDEGVLSSILNLYKRESISFTVNANSTNGDVIQFSFGFSEVDGFYGMILFDTNSTTNFRQDSDGVSRGLKPGQYLRVTVTDNTNKKNKYISQNNGITVKILRVFTKYLVVEFLDTIMTNEFTQIDDYPSSGNITYLTVGFEVIDRLIGKFNIYSQTEIEDIRYKIELSNTGHLIDPYDTFIFKTYDINEQGIDWTFLNKKRKEMLMVRDQIFPYVGSYKAIINAINFFGYNDLELYEYYRNIDTNSKDFYKLFKVEIPDIFDNSVEGWKENDFIKHTLPNPKFEDTNLFNLTYKITDKEGTNVLLYSLSEVILKLQGLKIWLEKKVIPITHRILDITGRADFVGVNTIQHKNYDTKILNVRQEFTPIDFSLNEAYLMPINSGSTVYTCHVDFFMGPVPTYSVAPDYFTVRIRTYKTYKEWNPFTTYQIGDRVTYYGVIYESVIPNNKIKNPRKYNGVLDWTANVDYQLGQYAKYNRDVYQYIGTQSSYRVFGTSSTLNPYEDIYTNAATASWFYMTEWKNMDLVPVQNLMEYRNVATYSLEEIALNPPPPGVLPTPIKAGHSFNFTIDSNIDPFITIEVTSDNGYGQIYTSKKNYEIRGLNDISDPIRYIDPIGPFQPIVQITNTI